MRLAIIVYIASMVSANLLVAHFGPSIAPILAFVFIGLDLVLRDWLHMRMRAWQMGSLIVGTGALSYALNPASGMIAIASVVAFTLAALADWATFAKLKGTWLVRSNGSNVVGAAVDSLIFPTLAFGVLMPQIILMQFIAKVAGGAIWSVLLRQRVKA
jgi:uncharacterized PurR-regulated membrane protein YhhQ (DUF165 family)